MRHLLRSVLAGAVLFAATLTPAKTLIYAGSLIEGRASDPIQGEDRDRKLPASQVVNMLRIPGVQRAYPGGRPFRHATGPLAASRAVGWRS